MCGIAGFCDHQKNFYNNPNHFGKLLEEMHDRLAHRGDDQFGTFLKEHAGLSHARLSIRDIAGGGQPMVRLHDGQEYAIVYNGEIYNTDELKAELTAAGYSFSTTSDTEVILNTFLHCGPEFVKKLNGIFAFAIWCEQERLLYLYRDRVGIKPLFYCPPQSCSQSPSASPTAFVFASEPKALFCHPDLTPRLTLAGLQEILGIGPARTMGNGIFDGVNEVLPGHYLVYDGSKISDHTYWDLTCHEHGDSYPATVEKTSFLVRDAVNRQMVSDVPVCTFLSGGIDSSIVTALAYNHLQEKGELLNTFSFDFAGNDKYFQSNSFQPEQDRPYVDIMLKRYPSNHTYLFCDETQLADELYTAVDAKDYPGMTDVDASLLYFCRLVKEHNKVCLTGECADEIFGGYPWFYRPELLNRDGFPWSADVSARTLFLNEDWIHALDLHNYSYDRYRTSLAQAPVAEWENEEQRKRRGVSYLNIKWFMQTLLDRMDRTSMYSGLEARVPFADHRIIEYLFNVPWEMKYQNGVEKALLRDATKDLLPDELFRRKKSPYPKTYHPGYEKLLTERLSAILDNPDSPILPLIDRDKALRFMQSPKEYGRPWFGQLMAGPQLMAYFIQLNYWMERYGLFLPC